MEFALLIFGEEKSWDRMPEQERAERFAANRAFGRALAEAGVSVRYGARLARPDVLEGEGRSGEGVLELGGLWLIEVATEEEALEWGAKVPAGPGNRVEVRRCDRPGPSGP
ncbi:YciI family protein [Streptomyces sp. NPDC006704]|uniref:YciI family protein n=1 Tax=Streptomyces sp. NPDC006704 TaxID=3364760 RepID=UPI0036831D49